MKILVVLVSVLAFAVAGCGDAAETGSSAVGVSGGEMVPSAALEDLTLSYGQLVYVPVYSHLGYMEGKAPFALAVNVSIRNTDRKHPIAVTSARYYDNDGKLLREYMENPRVLQPLGSTTILVRQSDMAGGLGANFLVEWKAKESVTEPVIEAVMLGQRETRTAAFRSPGRVIEERAAETGD